MTNTTATPNPTATLKVYSICVTRYNNATWAERTAWLAANPEHKCIYKSPVAIKSNIPYESPLFVIEMNNDTNRIMGVGRIVNEIRADRSYRIYSDQNYNRYTYLGRQRVDRADIMKSTKNAVIIETLERLLFYGALHSKRGQGIHELPAHIRNYPDALSAMLWFISRQFLLH
jgi:hypothetical protein